MDLRAILFTGLLATSLLVIVPAASAAPCDGGTSVDCSATLGNCDVEAGANVITTTYAGASADCQGGGTGTRCYTEAGVGQDLFDPTVEHWCAF